MESVIKSYIDCFGNSNLAICVVEAVMGSNNRADDFIFRYENDAMLKLTGVLREQIDNVNFSKSVFSDNKALLDILNTNIAENRNVIILEYSLRTDKYFNLQSYHIKDNLYGSIIADVSSHARTQIALTSTVNTFEGGLCLIKRDENGNMNKTYVSDGFCRMLGTSRDSIMNRCREDVFAGVYPDDKYKVRSLCDEHAADNEKFSASFRMHTASGEYIWVFANASVKTSGNGFIYYVTYTDITEQKKEETSAREREAMFGLALGNSDLSVWKYNFFENKLSFISLNDTAKTKIDGNELENFPQCILDAEDVREDSISVFTDMIERVKNGEDGVTGEVWFADKKLGGWWCEKITYSIVAAEDGKPSYAIGVGRNVTSIKEAEQRYREEILYQQELHTDSLIRKTRANITKNNIESFVDNNYSEEAVCSIPFDEGAKKLTALAYTKGQRSVIRRMLKRESIISSFVNGKRTHTVDYQIKLESGDIIWVRTISKLIESPIDNDIIYFSYTYDINNEKINNLVMSRLVNDDYEFIGTISVSTGKIITSDERDKSLYNHGDLVGKDYDTCAKEVFPQIVDEENQQDAVESMTLPAIIAGLEKQSAYVRTFSTRDAGDGKRYMMWKYSYLDDGKTAILAARTDITDIYRVEQQQKEILQTALHQAKQANAAKSEFLSRMSHEIRTPLNAIIGMTTLAAQCINDSTQVSDCLSKVGISARFLLSLINDILDMSRIESGKMFIKQEKIPFEEFINGINSICFPQASEKNIGYECVMTSFTEDFYIGDAMKLQQVLVNIISNAIKFTAPGGRVQFMVHQDKAEKDTAHLKFTINDTGVGINEEFIPKLFEPFEQEQKGNTAEYSGTGLGLAISKSIIDLMGGSISVNSILGVGTEFIIDVNLGISDETKKRISPLSDVLLAKMSALVVDDEVLVCQQTQKILNDMGLKAEWVSSGAEAVETVKSKWLMRQYYDIIFIDWKMPDMDGIETAKEIRETVGQDVTIIIITAYDWASIETEAKKAGVNMLISKPLFKTSLYSTFEKIYSEKEQISASKKEVEYDFSGKRVLLVDDHMLNVEVAKKLLLLKNMEVDVAENGLIALERFAEKPAEYYNAILMDIRMPVMDGLTSAKSIRLMTKETAKTIPIIAMSANAFDDDMEKSRKAGMNAHIAKPIEPQQLYAVLDSFIGGLKL